MSLGNTLPQKKLKKQLVPHPCQAPAAEAVPAGRRNGLVEQPRAHGAVGVVEAQARGDEARGGGGGGSRSGRRPPTGVDLFGKQRLLRRLQPNDGLRRARVQLQRIEKGGARVREPLQQVQRVAGPSRGGGPLRGQRPGAARVAERELGQVRRVEPEERARLGLRRRDGARGPREAGEGGRAAGAEDGLRGGVGGGGGGGRRGGRQRRRGRRDRAQRRRRRRRPRAAALGGKRGRARAGQPQREAELVRRAVEMARGAERVGAGGEGRGRVGVFLRRVGRERKIFS